MVIVLEKNIKDGDKARIKTFLEKNSLKVNEIAGEEETIFGAVGRLGIDPREVEILPGVQRVIPISKPYKMASREFKRENSVINVAGVKIGGARLSVIAGPCAVESREQIFESAARIAESGAVMLRGGAYKPRTSPYAFQGMGEEGVRLMKEAGLAYGLPIVTEIVSSEHISAMIDYVDVYQIGARNMQNFELLKKVGALGKPVILKRGLSATIEEWLMAAEYLLASGTEDVILCERGIRTYEKATRNTLDLSAIPVLRSLTHLPIIVDPSHAVGVRDKVAPMALAAVAAGADGLIVEVHPNPEVAMSDGPQSLYPQQFEKMMRDIEVLSPVLGKSISRRPIAPEKQIRLDKASPCGTARSLAANREKPITCAYSGDRGAYAEQAIVRYFDDAAIAVPQANFTEAIHAVLDGKADLAMLPIENSLAGSVYENYDNLARFEDVEIVGETMLRIDHSLLGVEGASLDTITTVYSHPQGFAQCSEFLQEHREWKHIETFSTSSAAELVAQAQDPTKAAIASEKAAPIYKLHSIKAGIETNPRNYTRFVLVARTGEYQCDSPNRASVIFSTANQPGALYHALGLFMKNGLNLTKLESRPIPGEPWNYRFYANVALPEGVSSSVVSGEYIKAALQEMQKISHEKGAVQEVRILGLYNEKGD